MHSFSFRSGQDADDSVTAYTSNSRPAGYSQCCKVRVPTNGPAIIATGKNLAVLHSDGSQSCIRLADASLGVLPGFSEGLAPMRNSRREWGYIDSGGNWQIKPQFESASGFFHGLALARRTNEPLCAIDRTTRIVAVFPDLWLHDEEDTSFYLPLDARSFVAWSSRTKPAYCLVTGLGEKISLPSVQWASGCVRDGVFAAEVRDGRWQMFSSSGIPVTNRDFGFMHEPTEGLVCAENLRGKMGALNTAGTIAIPFSFGSLGPFTNGFAVAEVGRDKMVVNRLGEPVLSSPRTRFRVFEAGILCESEVGCLLVDWRWRVVWRHPKSLRRTQLSLKILATTR